MAGVLPPAEGLSTLEDMERNMPAAEAAGLGGSAAAAAAAAAAVARGRPPAPP